MQTDGITLVFLSKGRVAIIDSADADLILPHNWYFNVSPAGHGYAIRDRKKSDGHGKGIIQMHRVVLGVETQIDHINGDKLDNRRSNLRPATRSQNNANGDMRRSASSIYRGITWNKRNRKWIAQIQKDGVNRYIGSFVCEETAARAWDKVAWELHGEFARLNFVR